MRTTARILGHRGTDEVFERPRGLEHIDILLGRTWLPGSTDSTVSKTAPAMEPVSLTDHRVPVFMTVSGLQSFQSFTTVLLPACDKSQSPSPVPSGT